MFEVLLKGLSICISKSWIERSSLPQVIHINCKTHCSSYETYPISSRFGCFTNTQFDTKRPWVYTKSCSEWPWLPFS